MLCNWSSSFFQSADSLTNSSCSHYHSHDALELPHIQYIQKWPHHLCSPFNLFPPPTEPSNPHLKTCMGPQRFFPKWKTHSDQGKNWLCPYPHIQAVWAKCPQSPLISLFRQWLPVLTLEDGAGSGPPLGGQPAVFRLSVPYHLVPYSLPTEVSISEKLALNSFTHSSPILLLTNVNFMFQTEFYFSKSLLLVWDLAWILLTILIASFLSLRHSSV